MLSKQDKAWLEKNFVTKEYLRGYLDLRFAFFEQKIEERFVTKEEFNRKFDIVIQQLDTIVGVIKEMRAELAAGTFRQLEHTAQIDNHERRLGFLENSSIKPL